jgi:hypothetical protein
MQTSKSSIGKAAKRQKSQFEPFEHPSCQGGRVALVQEEFTVLVQPALLWLIHRQFVGRAEGAKTACITLVHTNSPELIRVTPVSW